jgi:hypothetical protein
VDAAELSGLAGVIVTLAREVSPDQCHSAAECFQLTRDARESVRLMIESVRQRDLLDLEWISPWRVTPWAWPRILGSTGRVPVASQRTALPLRRVNGPARHPSAEPKEVATPALLTA